MSSSAPKRSSSKPSLSKLLSVSKSRRTTTFDSNIDIDDGHNSVSRGATSEVNEANKLPPTDAAKEIVSQSLALTDLIFGIYAIELWHYDESSGRLINVSIESHDEEIGERSSSSKGGGGLLIKRRTQETDPINNYSTTEATNAFDMLTDMSCRDYLVPSPTPAGVGIAGVLWSSESSSTNNHNTNNIGNMFRSHDKRTRLNFGSGSKSYHEKARTGLSLPGAHRRGASLGNTGEDQSDLDINRGSKSHDGRRTTGISIDLRHPFRSHRRGVSLGGGGRRSSGLDFSSGSRSNHEKRTGLSLPRRPSGRGWFHSNPDNILWRDVEELANDPDQPHDERLQSFAKAGFKLACGIPFDINGYRGIVIYYGNPHADQDKLRNPINSRLMKNAAQLIGTAAAIQRQMEEVKAYRKDITHQNWRRIKLKILAVVRFRGSLRRTEKGHDNDATDSTSVTSPAGRKPSTLTLLRRASSHFHEDAKETFSEATNTLKSRLTRWTKKIQGGSASIPPSFTYRQCLWTFIGVMITHTILSRMNELINVESDDELSLVLAPLGALTTLQYNLTAAPASQPRNAIFAQIFAITTAILLSYIPNVEQWFRSALAPAIVIPGMAKLGIIHPPAGAAAIVFSSGKFSWEHGGIFMAGVAISIITAVLINNMSDKRQYPTSWYLVSKAKRTL